MIVASTGTDVILDVTGYYTPPATSTWTYAYGVDGIRSKKTGPAGSTQFTWSAAGGLPLLLGQHDSTTDTFLIYGPGGQPIEQITKTGTTTTPIFLHPDQLGSVRLATDTTGNTVATRAWDAYGNPTTNTGTTKPLLGYAGQYTDQETGFQYLRARYYDPETSQFLAVDPLVVQTQEPYSYGSGNSINNTDPSGLWCLVHNDDGGCKGARAIEKYADDVANVAGTVAGVCGVGAVVTAETGVGAAVFGACYAAAESVSLGAGALHAAVTCADVDKYCRNAAGSFALNLASFGLASSIFPGGSLVTGSDIESLVKISRWVGGLNVTFFGTYGGWVIDTTERPKDC